MFWSAIALAPLMTLVAPGTSLPKSGTTMDRSDGAGSVASAASSSLNHLVGAQQNRLRDREAKRGRRLQIDYQLELGRLLYWQIGGFGTLENLIHEICCSAPKRNWSWPV